MSRSKANDAVLDRFREFARRHALRRSPVREAIVRAAGRGRGHFAVEDLLARLDEEGVRASRATVYRTLPLLLEAGIIQPTLLSGEQTQYEAAFGHEHHDHLICGRCGKVVEFQFEAFEMLQRDVAARHGFRLTGHFHELVGVCADCGERGDDN
jgi:Fur family transcriptional regulator, ferric uptake regulator